MPAVRNGVFGCLGVMLLFFGACKRDVPPPPPATTASPATAPPTERVVGPLSEADAKALATMNDRLKVYVEFHRKIEKTLPKLPDQATPQQIDSNQRMFEKLIRKERMSAKRGDIFTPEAEAVIKRLLASVFGGPDGKQLKASIMDENPVGLKLVVNGRYPDTGPYLERAATGPANAAGAERGHGVSLHRRQPHPARLARARHCRFHPGCISDMTLERLVRPRASLAIVGLALLSATAVAVAERRAAGGRGSASCPAQPGRILQVRRPR